WDFNLQIFRFWPDRRDQNLPLPEHGRSRSAVAGLDLASLRPSSTRFSNITKDGHGLSSSTLSALLLPQFPYEVVATKAWSRRRTASTGNGIPVQIWKAAAPCPISMSRPGTIVAPQRCAACSSGVYKGR